MIFSALISSPVFWTYEIYPNFAYKTGKACLSRIDLKEIAFTHALITMNGTLLYPVIILFFLTNIILLMIFKISKERRKLTNSYRPEKSLSSKEFQAAVVVFFLSAIQISVYIPSGILWLIYMFLAHFKISSSGLAMIFASFARTAISFTITCHFYNLFLYLNRIPSFRHDLRSIFFLKTQN